MRRTSLLLVAALAASSASNPSYALEASDSMAAWKNGSAEDKKKVVTEVLKLRGAAGSSAKVTECLDAAAGVSGHRELSIAEVATACDADSDDRV